MFLKGVTPASTYAAYPNIPEHLWFAYQMMFFLITPGLFIGAFAERMKFSAIMVFSILWSLLVYVPTCWGVWHKPGVLRPQKCDRPRRWHRRPHHRGCGRPRGLHHGGPAQRLSPAADDAAQSSLTVAGAGMLWVGWFGFNGGSQARRER
jgi:Amt family ammonium transporter